MHLLYTPPKTMISIFLLTINNDLETQIFIATDILLYKAI